MRIGLAKNFPSFGFFFLFRKIKWVLDPQDETWDVGLLKIFFTSKRVFRAALARGP